MSRPAGVSIAQLEKALAERKKALARLQRERAKLEKALKKVDGQIEALEGKAAPVQRKRAVKKVKVTGRKRGRKPGGKGTLREAVHKVLAKAEAAMNVKQIAEAALKAGYKTKSKNLATSVIPIVYKDPAIKKVGRGKFALK